MKTLETRLFHLFDPTEVAAARDLVPAAVSCPRVGQVRATVPYAGEDHQVLLELSAHRRGGMTLESQCSTQAGRAGRPCAVLAAVLLEVDRRGLLSGIHDQTPVTLDIVGGTSEAEEPLSQFELTGQSDAEPHSSQTEPAVTGTRSPTSRSGQRLPPWAAELEERRRLVEPAVRVHGVEIPDARRVGGALVFLLDTVASADARAAVVTPCRMQLDVAGNATGRPRSIVIGPGEVELETLDQAERDLLERLLGAAAATDNNLPQPIDRRTISKIVMSPRSAAAHLALLCETGRLVVQPEPRRAPEQIVPLTWDDGRPWEFAFVVEPDDDALPRGRRSAGIDDEDAPPPRPAKATLTAALVRGANARISANLGRSSSRVSWCSATGSPGSSPVPQRPGSINSNAAGPSNWLPGRSMA